VVLKIVIIFWSIGLGFNIRLYENFKCNVIFLLISRCNLFEDIQDDQFKAQVQKFSFYLDA